MKKKTVVGIVGTVLAIIAIYALSSCSEKAVPETEEEFWAEIGELENYTEKIFEEMVRQGTVRKQDIKRLEKLQDSLDYICEEASTTSYYNKISYYVDWYKDSYVVTIDKNYKRKETDLFSFENGILEFEGAKGAILLENAEGPVFELNETDDFDGMFDIEKKYNVINAKKDAYILARGLESGYTLYILKPSAKKLSNLTSKEDKVTSSAYSASNFNFPSKPTSDQTILIVNLIVFFLLFLLFLCLFIVEKKKASLIFAIISISTVAFIVWVLFQIA